MRTVAKVCPCLYRRTSFITKPFFCFRGFIEFHTANSTSHVNHTNSSISSGQESNHEDFFRHTTGRWLWDEQVRLQERYKRFNVSALQKIAASSVGARRCVSMAKLAEGGFNRVFRLVMDNSAVVIARIPYSSDECASHAIASEVATIDFVSGGTLCTDKHTFD